MDRPQVGDQLHKHESPLTPRQRPHPFRSIAGQRSQGSLRAEKTRSSNTIRLSKV